METLAERLKFASKKADLTQAKLARLCGVKPPSVSDWFSGKTKRLEGMNLFNAAKALSVRPEWLADGKGHPYEKAEQETRTVMEESPMASCYFRVGGRLRDRKVECFYASPNATASINSHHQYILAVEDNSYAPRLRRGDRILVDPERKPQQYDDILIHSKSEPGRVSICCLLSDDESIYAVLDPDDIGGQSLFWKKNVASVEVIAAIFPASSMPKLVLKHFDEGNAEKLKQLKDGLNW